MCGRIVTDLSEIQYKFFDVDDGRRSYRPQRPRYNVAPTTVVGCVKNDQEGNREMVDATWNLRPQWAKDGEKKRLLHNARAETVATLPSFRSAFKCRRCLVPASGYYEWRKADKQPFYYSRVDGHPLAFAGIFEIAGDGRCSTCIITTTPNAEAAEVHDRMPVILRREFWSRWLEPDQLTEQERTSMLVPAPDGTLSIWPVDRTVGSVRNDNPGLILPRDQQPPKMEPPDTPDLFNLDSQ